MNHCVWSFQTSCHRIDAGNTSLDPVFSCDPVGGRLKRQTKTKCRLAKTIRKRTSCARVRTISSSNTFANSCASSHHPPRQTGAPPSAARWFSRLARLFFRVLRGTDKTALPTFLDQRGPVACLMIRATCSSRRAEPQRVCGDWRFKAAAIPQQSVAVLAQVTDFREHALLAGIWFDVLAVRAEPESEPDIADPLPARALVP